MQSLREIYESHEGRLLNKWEHYIDIYDQFFNKFRNKDIVFVEIGIAHGGSLQMWRKYFGEKATIIGIDVNPECKKFEEGNTKIYIGFNYWWNIHLLLRIMNSGSNKDGVKLHDWMFV